MKKSFYLGHKTTGWNGNFSRTELKTMLINHYICSLYDIFKVVQWFSHSLNIIRMSVSVGWRPEPQYYDLPTIKTTLVIGPTSADIRRRAKTACSTISAVVKFLFKPILHICRYNLTSGYNRICRFKML